MLLSTTETIHGKTIVKHLGLVRGNTIRARHVGKDILAGLRNLVGGEISEYTKLLGESREQALDRMIEEAKRLGANAVIGVRFSTSEVMTTRRRSSPTARRSSSSEGRRGTGLRLKGYSMEAWREWLRPELIWFFIGLLLLFVEMIVPGLIIAFFAFGAWVVAVVHLFTPLTPEPAVGPVHHGLGPVAGAGPELAQGPVHRLRQLPAGAGRGPSGFRRRSGRW